LLDRSEIRASAAANGAGGWTLDVEVPASHQIPNVTCGQALVVGLASVISLHRAMAVIERYLLLW
jgi:hypothetical protein